MKVEKIRVRKLIDLHQVLTNLRNFTRIVGRFMKGAIVFDLDSGWKEPYPNRAENVLDDNGKDYEEKNEETS